MHAFSDLHPSLSILVKYRQCYPGLFIVHERDKIEVEAVVTCNSGSLLVSIELEKFHHGACDIPAVDGDKRTVMKIQRAAWISDLEDYSGMKKSSALPLNPAGVELWGLLVFAACVFSPPRLRIRVHHCYRLAHPVPSHQARHFLRYREQTERTTFKAGRFIPQREEDST